MTAERSSLVLSLVLSLALSLALALAPSACLLEPPDVDLDGPRILSSSLGRPRSVELPVLPELAIELSEPLDPASVHPGTVALVRWELLDARCDFSPICEEGSCERGRCQGQPLTATQRGALERGEFDASSEHAVALDFALEAGEAGPGTRLVLRPRRPLDGHRRHSLVLGPGLRDQGGAPLVDERGQAQLWQRDFVTAGWGSAGPEAVLVGPAPGQGEVATNLAVVDTRLWPPVPVPQPAAVLALEADDGSATVELVDPVDCPGWVPGTCLRWRPRGILGADRRYRPAGGTLVDRLGRPSLRPAAARETWFATGPGPDDDAPAAEVSAELRGRCLALWLDAGEAVEASLSAGGLERRGAIHGAGWIGVELDGLAPGELLAWSVELRDLAGNLAVEQGELVVGPSFAEALPRLRITELLANPSGPEPDAEFVEIQAGPLGADLDGVWLADQSPAQLRAAWLAGEELPGDALPRAELRGGELAIIVADGWSPHNPKDPAPPEHTPRLVVDGSLGEGGLKNAGEPLTLWTLTADGPVTLASYGDWIDTSASAHGGRSVVSGVDGCDLPDRWRAHPQGRSTPGALP